MVSTLDVSTLASKIPCTHGQEYFNNPIGTILLQGPEAILRVESSVAINLLLPDGVGCPATEPDPKC